MIKKYIKNYPVGGSWDIEKPEWYGNLQVVINCQFARKFTFTIEGRNYGRLRSASGFPSGPHLDIYLFKDLHEFGSCLEDGGIGDTYTLEVIEMDEKEFQALSEFEGY